MPSRPTQKENKAAESKAAESKAADVEAAAQAAKAKPKERWHGGPQKLGASIAGSRQ